jgi:hypothetical protein
LPGNYVSNFSGAATGDSNYCSRVTTDGSAHGAISLRCLAASPRKAIIPTINENAEYRVHSSVRPSCSSCGALEIGRDTRHFFSVEKLGRKYRHKELFAENLVSI